MISNIQKHALTTLVGAILVSIVILGGYLLYSQAEPDAVRLPLVKDCKLQQQSCSAKLVSGGEILFDISPKNPKPTEALYLTARFKNISHPRPLR